MGMPTFEATFTIICGYIKTESSIILKPLPPMSKRLIKKTIEITGLPVMVGLFLFLPSKISLKNQTSLQEKKFAAGVKNQKRLWKIGIRGSLIQKLSFP